MRYKILTVFFLLVWILCVSLLVSGSPLLGETLFGGGAFPLGTLVTWIGLAVLPVSFYTGFPALRHPEKTSDRIFLLVLLIILIVAGLWGIVAYILSGNWSYTFKGNGDGFSGSNLAAKLFWRITYFTVAIEWFFILIYMFSKWLARLTNLAKGKPK